MKLLILIAIVLFFAEGLIVRYLGQENALLGLFAGLPLGSVTMMPGLIAYPLAGVLTYPVANALHHKGPDTR